MKSKIYLTLCLLFPLLYACDRKTDKAVYVNISNILYNKSGLHFTLESSNAERLTYRVYETGDTQSPEIDVEPKETQYIAIEEIEQDRTYIIKATAYNGDNMAEKVATVTTSIQDLYEKKLLVTKFTGTWCGYCPEMTASLEKMQSVYPDKFITVALHGRDELTVNEYMEPLDELFGITGYPTAILDYAHYSTQQFIMLKDRFDKLYTGNPAVCGISIRSSIDGNILNISASAEFGVSGHYAVCCAIVENNIHLPGTFGSYTGYYDHVMRTFATSPLGDEIGQMEMGSSKDFHYEVQLNENWNRENLEIIIYLLKKGYKGNFGDIHYVNNAASGKIGEDVPIIPL